MRLRAKKKARTLPEDIGDEDRVSRLPDDLLHKIMSFFDAKVAVQTSVLSRRWKLVWTSLPFLTFGPYNYDYEKSSDKNDSKFIRHVLSNRNHQSRISELNFCVNDRVFSKGLLEKFVEYAISHDVQSLTLDRFIPNYKLSTLSSRSLEKLKLRLSVEMEPESDCWDLPSLTTLHLRCRNLEQFPYSWFTCLPALRTLCLTGNILPSSFSLTNLSLSNCTIEFCEDHKPYKLSTFSSKSLEKLTLRVNLEECQLESDYWDLPSLTTLHLKYPRYYDYKFNILSKSWLSDSLFKCLPSLRTLCLYEWDLSKPSFSFSLPAITTLHLSNCELTPTRGHPTVWDFPALTSLQLDGHHIPDDMRDIFSALVNLQNLTLFLPSIVGKCYFISCPPQLLNLSIRASFSQSLCGTVVVSAPKLCNFTSFGIFTPTIGVPELENVNIRLQGWFQNVQLEQRKKHYRLLTNMLPGLGNAKNLTFDLETIKALNEISYLLVSLPSPFCKLKYVKLPWGFKESSVSSALRSYLLSGSSKATIVTKLLQYDVNPHIAQVPPMPQHIDGKVTQVGALVQGFGRPRPNISGAGNDSTSSSTRNNDVGLWKGHEVNLEFVDLLDLILKKYPETFEHFTTKSKKLCTMKLNMLCTSINVFTLTTMTEIDTEMITEYRTLFSDLQRSFNVKWLVSRLNYIEQLQLSQHDLPAVDSCTDGAFRTMDAKFAASAAYIGDGLFSDP